MSCSRPLPCIISLADPKPWSGPPAGHAAFLGGIFPAVAPFYGRDSTLTLGGVIDCAGSNNPNEKIAEPDAIATSFP